MTTRRRSRPGVTLTEVLVAIFVMALGLLALLTLFPLGAIQMAQALKDDRTTQTALQADGTLRSYWRHNVITSVLANKDVPLVQALSDPLYTAPPLGPEWGPAQYRQFVPHGSAAMYPPIPDTADVPSYPVMIDPLGLFAQSPNSPAQFWVGWRAETRLRSTPLVARRNLSMVINQPNHTSVAIQTCCLTDDFTFRPNGSPTEPGGSLSRQGRYSWAAVIQRPNNTNQDVATLKILVFDGRPPLLATPGDEVVLTNVTIDIPGVQRAITLSVPNRGADQLPLIRKGGWIMDGTINPTLRHANFYRISGVTEIGPDPVNPNNTVFSLDLETEIKRADGLPAPYPAQIYLFAGLAEVFERPALVPDP
jgi:hypothetical protein